jgi:charged multivesicular body protein 5
MYKQRCVQVLKKRKQYDNQLKGYMNQQFTLDQVAFTSDNIQNTIEMVKFMLLRPKL